MLRRKPAAANSGLYRMETRPCSHRKPPRHANEPSNMTLSPTASPASRAATVLWLRAAVSAAPVAGLLLLGFVLRLLASRGPVWNDEIWSLQNLRPIHHFWQVLWDISHDNNHFLNSLWLFFASPISDNPTWLRLPSILAGVCAIPVMAHLGARHSRAAAIVAAALTAGSFFQFTYSVEARGYATAMLALIVAFAALERSLDSPSGGARWILAAAAGVGFFSHLAMAPAIVVLGAAGLAEDWRRRRDALGSLKATARLFWPAGLAMLPTLAFFVAGYINKGGFTIGYPRAYATSRAIGAMVNLEMATFGLPPNSFWLFGLALFVLPPLLLVAIAKAALPERRIAYFAFFTVIPAAVLTLQPPNTHAARYFFAASPFLLLLAAESFSQLWKLGGWRRAAALAALAASLTGDGLAIAQTLAGERSPWTDALSTILESRQLTLATSFDFNVGRNVDYFNRARGVELDLVPAERLCAQRPAWYIVQMAGDVAPDPTIDLAGAGCRLTYTFRGEYNRVPSQLPWSLYRLQDATSGGRQ